VPLSCLSASLRVALLVVIVRAIVGVIASIKWLVAYLAACLHNWAAWLAAGQKAVLSFLLVQRF